MVVRRVVFPLCILLPRFPSLPTPVPRHRHDTAVYRTNPRGEGEVADGAQEGRDGWWEGKRTPLVRSFFLASSSRLGRLVVLRLTTTVPCTGHAHIEYMAWVPSVVIVPAWLPQSLWRVDDGLSLLFVLIIFALSLLLPFHAPFPNTQVVILAGFS